MDDAKTKQAFANVNAVVQFKAEDAAGPIGAHLKFNNGELEVVQELTDAFDIQFSFPSVAKFIDMFKGKPVIPRIKGLTKIGLLIKVFGILFGHEDSPAGRQAQDVREEIPQGQDDALHGLRPALSQLNKGGDPDMTKFTARQPERIYQWSVTGTDIACHLKVKAGKTKAGRGKYPRRKPFVHMIFKDVDSALPILGNQIDTVQAMASGMVENEGSPEYGGEIGDLMLKIAGMLS